MPKSMKNAILSWRTDQRNDPYNRKASLLISLSFVKPKMGQWRTLIPRPTVFNYFIWKFQRYDNRWEIYEHLSWMINIIITFEVQNIRLKVYFTLSWNKIIRTFIHYFNRRSRTLANISNSSPPPPTVGFLVIF